MMDPGELEPLPRKREHYINCEFCGHQNLRSARLCAKCGARISLSAVARAYIDPIAQRFGLVVLLAIPTALVCLVTFSFIAGGLGLGDTVRPVVNALTLGVGVLALVVLVVTIVILTYHKKPKKK
ncbi:MAG: hypothetical protein K0S68_595 [Candidatus Saccharibacteria bacterium]|jgi:hypothetical protein|nr:hypothetical protein [Candidatus Saccharibacteria bacterium]